MSTQQTLDVLKAHASLLRGCGDEQGAVAVRALIAALSADGDAKTKATLGKVQKLWTRSPELAASSRGLYDRLDALHGLLAAGGAKAPLAADIKLLAALLDGREEVDTGEFERRLRCAIEAPVPTRPARTTNAREPLSAAEVRQWADRLTAVTTDQAAFEAELSAVLSIPKLSVAELMSIAEHYLGYAPPKGKAPILKKLRTRQMQDAMEAGRQSRIQRIAV